MVKRLASCASHRAFTLMEMAIVLTIIGLLVGAVVGGSRLLRQSELQTIITNQTKYSAAFAQFKQQYGGYPGDMIDATSFWPAATNGNGDGAVNSGVEPYQAWTEMVAAKLIEGNYSGAGASASIGINVPRARIANSGWSLWYKDDTSADAVWYDQGLGNMLAFGGPVAGSITQSAAISAPEAWQLDTKVDDGLPATGRVVSLKPGGSSPTPSCTTSTTDASALYARTTPGNICGLNFSLVAK